MTEHTPPPQRFSTVAVILAVIALIVAAVAVALIVRHTGDRTTATTSSATPVPATGSPGTSEPSAGTAPRTTTAPPAHTFGFQPLWPFSGIADAEAWQREANPGGHQPWHLDAGLIAQMFTTQYLGYTGVDKIVKTDVRGDQAWVNVGFTNPNGAMVTAAVVHLAQIGSGADQPWEVVGTQDSTLTVTTPAYGSALSSPLTVGGSITGVDESLRVQVRGGANQQQPVGQVAGIPAGGTNSPWTVTVPLTAACPGTLTVAVSTGGHIADVERFAVTGVHC
ncbi:Gmad2 immunoglobulin-like domain-containing protein [Nocardia sp. NBC_01503]|uniref:hypothetical protein n=1 Tax=Nocardia sp. NBC_01503 TaxID=2975997 RepID=UPI002E7C0A01|nr:hypothetical protein [Nocardia sp. NBC_01503]WTL31050.1 Gmad2 immunoglobulin-like domain-containing protein [Nocardia sp. NBC_01503]